jgi:hypothetical protein
MDKYFKEIMPEIRKTCKYIIKNNDKKELDKLNIKVNNYKQELLYYYDKYDFTLSKNGKNIICIFLTSICIYFLIYL